MLPVVQNFSFFKLADNNRSGRDEKIFECLIFSLHNGLYSKKNQSCKTLTYADTPILCLFLIFILQNQSGRVSHSICTDPFKFEKC